MAPPVADDLLLSLSAKQRVTVQRSQEVVRSRVLLRSHTEAAGSAHYDYNPRREQVRGRAGAPLAAGEATTPVPAGLAACTRRWGVKYRFAAPVHCPTACTALTLYTTLLLPVPAGNLAGAGCRQALRAGAGKLLGADGAGRRPVEHQLRPVRGRRHVTGLLGSRDWGAARDSIVRLAVLTPSSPVHGSRIKIEVHAE